MKDIYVVFEKIIRNSRKTAIYQSQILKSVSNVPTAIFGWLKCSHSALRWLAKIKFILASWILKTSLDLTKSNTKTWFKEKLNDWIFQKIACSNQLLHRIKFLMDFNWIRHTSAGQRRLLFIVSAVYAKITLMSYIKKCPGLSCQYDLFLHKKTRFEPFVAFRSIKSRKKQKRD